MHPMTFCELGLHVDMLSPLLSTCLCASLLSVFQWVNCVSLSVFPWVNCSKVPTPAPPPLSPRQLDVRVVKHLY